MRDDGASVSSHARWHGSSKVLNNECMSNNRVGDGDIAAQATTTANHVLPFPPAMANKKSASDESSKVGLCGKEASWP